MNGLEVFNPDGTTRNNVADNLTRVLGAVNVSGWAGMIAWPYPDIANDRRIVTTVSNRPIFESEVSNAWAYYNRATGMVEYSQGEDLVAITLLFMTF